MRPRTWHVAGKPSFLALLFDILWGWNMNSKIFSRRRWWMDVPWKTRVIVFGREKYVRFSALSVSLLFSFARIPGKPFVPSIGELWTHVLLPPWSYFELNLNEGRVVLRFLMFTSEINLGGYSRRVRSRYGSTSAPSSEDAKENVIDQLTLLSLECSEGKMRYVCFMFLQHFSTVVPETSQDMHGVWRARGSCLQSSEPRTCSP